MLKNNSLNYAQSLLKALGREPVIPEMLAQSNPDSSIVAWQRSGLKDVSGLTPPVPIMDAANGALIALKALSDTHKHFPDNGALLLGERARLMGIKRNGRTCPGGFCRLLDAADGRLALNLAREDDWGLIPAWLEADASTWEAVETEAKSKDVDDLVLRGRELGLAVAKSELRYMPDRWFQKAEYTKADNNHVPIVVDLSSLWAGPLAGSLLSMMGARVIKVESLSRPDGARRGHAEFYQLLNARKECAAFDFKSAEGAAQLKALIDKADIVIEASRPRALRQLGIIAEDMIKAKPGKVWLGLTAYGRSPETENWVGFGDDVGVAAGLSAVTESAMDDVAIVGDAIADPITGLHGALAAWSLWKQGGGCLIDMPMVDVMRHAMQEPIPVQEVEEKPLYNMRNPVVDVRDVGADTDSIMADLC